MKARPKILLFDIDGTLLLTGGAGRVAIERAFQDLFGIKNSWENLIPDGKTDPFIFQEIADRILKRPLKPRELLHLRRIYLTFFRRELVKAKRFRLMPGVHQLLAELSQDPNCYLGIQTGNYEAIARLKLARGRLHRYFRFGGFGSDSPERISLIHKALQRGRRLIRRPVARESIFIIGDSPRDILSGKKLRLRTIAVATGRASLDSLAACKPDYAVEDLSDRIQFMAFVKAPRAGPTKSRRGFSATQRLGRV